MMRAVTEDEICRVRICNAKIRNENHLLRCTLRNLTADPYKECGKVLGSVIDHCTKKLTEAPTGEPDRSCDNKPKFCVSSCPDPCSPGKARAKKPYPKKTSNPSCFYGLCTPSKASSSYDKYKLTTKTCCKPCCTSFNPPKPSFQSVGQSIKPSSYSPPMSKSPPCKLRCDFNEPLTSKRNSFSSNSSYKSRSLSSSFRNRPSCSCAMCSPFTFPSRNYCSNNTTDEEESLFNNNKDTANCTTDSDINQNRASSKILGELAFQLERRILDYVFGMENPNRRRFYGYTVSNICSMMDKECKNALGIDDLVSRSELASRLKKLLVGLNRVGYNIKEHAEFAQQIINRYGLLPCPPDASTIEEFGLHNAGCIAVLINQLAYDEDEASDLQILLRSLKFLSKCDGRPLFVW